MSANPKDAGTAHPEQRQEEQTNDLSADPQTETASAVDSTPGTENRTDGEHENAEAEAPESTTSPRERAFVEQLKQLAVAATSAVKASPEDVKALVSRLVEKGELAQQDARKILNEVGDWVRKTASDPVTRAREAAEHLLRGRDTNQAGADGEQDSDMVAQRVQATLERVLKAMHIATSKDVEALEASIARLEETVQTLVERTNPTRRTENANHPA